MEKSKEVIVGGEIKGDCRRRDRWSAVKAIHTTILFIHALINKHPVRHSHHKYNDFPRANEEQASDNTTQYNTNNTQNSIT